MGWLLGGLVVLMFGGSTVRWSCGLLDQDAVVISIGLIVRMEVMVIKLGNAGGRLGGIHAQIMDS